MSEIGWSITIPPFPTHIGADKSFPPLPLSTALSAQCQIDLPVAASDIYSLQRHLVQTAASLDSSAAAVPPLPPRPLSASRLMAIPGEQSGTDGILSHERNWSRLPEDLLHLFSKKLLDISDFIRFRAVCKSWQLSAPVTDPPPQLPWVLEIRFTEERENAIVRFYCLLSGNVHTITCPDSRHAWLQGPACRYLLATHLKNSERYLLNPLTCDKIHVPFVCECPDYIGPDPIEGGDIMVISGINNYFDNSNTPPNFMAFWQPKADDWVFVDGVGCSANAYYMGQYFSNDEVTGITNVIDIATQKLVYQVASPEGINPLLKGRTSIVESGGKILRLFHHFEAESCHFDIYCLYFSDGEEKPCWVTITDIGDQMLFLQNCRGLSFCVSNFTGFKSNCIYFLESKLHHYKRYLCRYDIGDGTTEVLPCPFDSMDTWFVPSLV
ncbi:putative F-box/kelch-repeat protein At5g24040 [Carex rostrata]